MPDRAPGHGPASFPRRPSRAEPTATQRGRGRGPAAYRPAAWLHGRTAVDEDILAILRHVLWDVVEQIAAVERKTLALTSPMTQQCDARVVDCMRLPRRARRTSGRDDVRGREAMPIVDSDEIRGESRHSSRQSRRSAATRRAKVGSEKIGMSKSGINYHVGLPRTLRVER
ncbi:MAG TPA: hypothetical protein VKP64_03075 [Mycobacteriales bacterium]|nr:hypothetical protein [Mycobacteriales bacterium]